MVKSLEFSSRYILSTYANRYNQETRRPPATLQVIYRENSIYTSPSQVLSTPSAPPQDERAIARLGCPIYHSIPYLFFNRIMDHFP
jgi:hypothetical protein